MKTKLLLLLGAALIAAAVLAAVHLAIVACPDWPAWSVGGVKIAGC